MKNLSEVGSVDSVGTGFEDGIGIEIFSFKFLDFVNGQ